MDVTATLAVLAPPALDHDAADSRDPAVAAAFTAVLAGMMTTAPPTAATLAEGESPPADATGATPLALVAPAVAPAPPEATLTDAAPATPAASASPAAPAPNQPVAPGADAAPVTQADPAGPQIPQLSTPPPAPPIAARWDSARDAAADTAAPFVAERATAAVVGPAALPDGEVGAGDEPEARGTGDVPVAPEAIPPAPTARLAGAARAAPPVEPSRGRMVERALAAQVVHRIGRLVDDGDGHHELSLQLEPADLGRLELRVRLEAGVVHVHVEAQARGTTDLLRQALPELRAALSDAGLSAGGLDIHDHSALAGGGGGLGNPHRRPAGDAAEPHRTIRAADTRIASPVVIGSGASRGVDVLL